MSAVVDRPTRYLESGTAARQLDLSITRLHEIGAALGLPAARTDGGRRLWTPEEIAVIRRQREARAARAIAVRPPDAA